MFAVLKKAAVSASWPAGRILGRRMASTVGYTTTRPAMWLSGLIVGGTTGMAAWKHSSTSGTRSEAPATKKSENPLKTYSSPSSAIEDEELYYTLDKDEPQLLAFEIFIPKEKEQSKTKIQDETEQIQRRICVGGEYFDPNEDDDENK